MWRASGSHTHTEREGEGGKCFIFLMQGGGKVVGVVDCGIFVWAWNSFTRRLDRAYVDVAVKGRI